jgi:hypothetical protein
MNDTLHVIPSPFEVWATRKGYDIAPAVVPLPIRTYAESSDPGRL